MEFDVGARLRAVRKERKLSQREVAVRAGVTNGMISLIEGNKTSPSVSSLKKVLAVLDMSLSEFFEGDETEPEQFVFRKDALSPITPEQTSGAGLGDALVQVRMKRVGPVKKSGLLLLHEIYEPGADTGEPYTHEGEECGFVIEGELLLEVDGVRETLVEGDAYLFESTKPHRFRNVGERRCVLITCCTPPTF